MASINMTYTRLGNSGLKVSRIGLGNWVNDNSGNDEKSQAIVKYAFEQGVNWFDTAENYGPNGIAEITLGKALKGLDCHRSDLVVSTKLFWGDRHIGRNKIRHNTVGTSRKHLMEGIDLSLKNLQLDYVDILYLHRYDSETPIEETVLAMKTMVEKGQILYWGTSEWPAVRLMQVMYVCDKLLCPRPIVEQSMYNMLVRDQFEANLMPLVKEFGLGLNSYSPLACGILTGKYNKGMPEDSRFNNNPPLKNSPFWTEHMGTAEKEKSCLEILAKLEDYSKKLDCTMAQMCLAWTISWDACSCATTGATSIEQLQSNLDAVSVVEKLTPEVMKDLNEILGNVPVQDWYNRDWPMGFTSKLKGPREY